MTLRIKRISIHFFMHLLFGGGGVSLSLGRLDRFDPCMRVIICRHMYLLHPPYICCTQPWFNLDDYEYVTEITYQPGACLVSFS